MARFHTLTVTDIKSTIRDAVVLTLQPEETHSFSFTQGQYLTFRRDFDGVELRRNYSICSGVNDMSLQVGIKRVDGGSFSTWANTELKVGDTLEAMPPAGNFAGSTETDGCNKHLLNFAAGSGITPILSIIRTALSEEPNTRCTLIYANRNINTIMFREELEDLKNLYMGRLNVIHILKEAAQDIELFTGRIDAEKCAALFKHAVDLSSVTTAYICGPKTMMHTVHDALVCEGIARQNIRIELFTGSQPGLAKNPASSVENTSADVEACVTLDGSRHRLHMAKNTSLLNAALANNIDAPFACTAGVCSTCKAIVTGGDVEMIANHALEDYEVEAGYVLTCQCYPRSDSVEWSYDHAHH